MDGDYKTSRQHPPGYDDWAADVRGAPDARARRADGVRRVRKMSNWTAAALVAGVAVTSAYFAHAATVGTQAGGYSGSSGQGQPGTAVTGHKAGLTHPVVTSGGSGATAGSGGAGGSGGSGWRDN